MGRTNAGNSFFGPDIEGSETRALQLTDKYRRAWLEDVFHLEKRHGRNAPLPAANAHIGSSISQKRIAALLAVVAIFFAVFFLRLAGLQLQGGGGYRALAEGNRQRILPIPSERGLFFDRNGVQLVKNVPKFSLALIPQDLPRNADERMRVIARLSELTNQEASVIEGELQKFGSYSYESVVVKEDLPYETALAIQIASADLRGIHIQRGSKRLYLDGAAATSTPAMSALSLAHILGYLGKLDEEELASLYTLGYLPSDDVGKTGLELQYETELRGTYGRRRIEVNALGREQSVIAEEAPKPGRHLRLTIDYDMQAALEKIVRSTLAANDLTKAAAIALDPNTGDILAMVSIPAFDNNDFSGGISREAYDAYIANPDHPLFNRAISGAYPSGSAIKPAIAAAALEDGVITPATTFPSTGGLRVAEWFFPDWLPGGHGDTSVTKAIAWSVNTFFYTIGGGYQDFAGLGIDRISAYLRKFGFANQLGIDIPGEASGFLPSKEWKEETKNERWYIGDTYNVSIGQGDVLVTPLQIAEMTAAIANGGTLFTPRVVAATIDPVTSASSAIEPAIIRSEIIRPEYLRIVRQGMRECVEYGSCRSMSLLPFAVAGKTGTAQWSSTKEPHAWFTSFAPYEHSEIVVTVLVEEGGEGSAIAAPIAREFYQWWGTNRLR